MHLHLFLASEYHTVLIYLKCVASDNHMKCTFIYAIKIYPKHQKQRINLIVHKNYMVLSSTFFSNVDI